jgi:hypothetical protein
MRDLTELDRYRITDPAALAPYGGWAGDGTRGAFLVTSLINRQPLVVIASANAGWDHISVSRKDRVPNWYEMERVKRLFFKDTETAMQLHVPVAEHINCHPRTLHLWRPHDQAIPLPPSIFV